MASEGRPSRRQFLRLGAAAGAAAATITTLGSRILGTLSPTVPSAARKASRLLPAFVADADTRRTANRGRGTGPGTDPRPRTSSLGYGH